MSSGQPYLGVVILAAGASTRLGQPKQLLVYQGESLLHRAARIGVEFAAGAPVVVVLGAHADRFREELTDLPVTIAVNSGWEEGMASSVRAGISALAVSPSPVDAAIIHLCDQPRATPETLHALAAAHRAEGRPAVTSVYENGNPGPPCLFARSLFPGLLALEGAQGAKRLLDRLPETDIARVSFDGGAHDIDTRDDWTRFNNETK